MNLTWLILRFLDRTGICTRPEPGPRNPCKTVSETMTTWRTTPQWLVIWRARRAITIIYPTTHPRMHLITATRTKNQCGQWAWIVTFTAGCGTGN